MQIWQPIRIEYFHAVILFMLMGKRLMVSFLIIMWLFQG